MKRLLALTGTLALAVSCGKDDDSENRADCHLPAIDLSSCDRYSLSTVQADGVWNVNVRLNDGTGAPGAMRLSSESEIDDPLGLILGLKVSERTIDASTFFLASQVQDSNQNEVRYVLAGCKATTPSRMAGFFRRCLAGTMDLQGTFEAVRLSRPAGEEEASGVTLVSETALPRVGATELTVANGHVYVAAGKEGLFIYDVSDPAHPREVAKPKPSDDVWNDVLVNGTTLYIASSKNGVMVYDVSNPGAPTLVRSVPTTGVDTRSLALDNNVLYAAAPYPNAEILVYDVTDPQAPKQLTRYFVENSVPDLGERPMDLVASGGRLYVSHLAYGLTVSDVTTPSKPKLLGRYGGVNSRQVAVGTVNGRTLAFEADEDWNGHLRVLDVGVPANVLEVGGFQIRPEVSVRSMALSGTRLYLAHNQDGLRVLDVSVPGEPHQVGYYNTWRAADKGRGVSFFEGLNSVKAPGDGYIYTTESARGLLIFRETPAAP